MPGRAARRIKAVGRHRGGQLLPAKRAALPRGASLMSGAPVQRVRRKARKFSHGVPRPTAAGPDLT